MQARLVAIRANLDRLRADDQGLRIHGAGGEHGHGYRELPALTRSRVEQLESGYGIALPSELRSFLMTVHGGGAGPGYGLDVVGSESPRHDVVRPFPYGHADAERVIEAWGRGEFASLPISENEVGDWPPGDGFIPVCHYGCGAFAVIVVTGEQSGRMWRVDGGWVPCHAGGAPFGFLDWYEDWLDKSLAHFQTRPQSSTGTHARMC